MRRNRVHLDKPLSVARRVDVGRTAASGGPQTISGSTSPVLTLTSGGAGTVQLGQSITGSTSPVLTLTSGGAGLLGFGISGVTSPTLKLIPENGALIQRELTLFIKGIDRTQYLLESSLNIQLQLSQAATATFGIWDPAGDPAIIPQVGQEVLIYRNSVRIFGGSVEQPVEAAFQGLRGHIFSGSGGGSGGVSSATSGSGAGSGGVQCTDFSNLLDRRYVGLTFQPAFGSVTLFEMVTAIINTYFAQDGFSYDSSNGSPGADLGPQVFNWVTGRQALNTIGSLAGWDWDVDAFKVLRFFPSGTGLGNAPFNITDSDGHITAESQSLLYYRSTYRNRQGIRSPAQSTPLWTDVFSAAHPGPFPNEPQPPDGVRRQFGTLYSFTTIPTITVNGVPQIVIDLDTQPITTPGATWYVLLGGTSASAVNQIQTHPPLGPGDVLVVSYSAQISPIYWVQDDAQIAARAAIEGNSGVYEDVQDAPNTVTDPAAIAAYAQSLLTRYGSQGIPYQVSYSTDDLVNHSPQLLTHAIKPGQLQTILLGNPAIALLGGLIKSVRITDVNLTFLRYDLVVLSGLYQGDWTQFFAALVGQAQLPQPSAQNTYNIPVGQTVPNVTNTGANGGTQPLIQIVINSTEIFQSFRVQMTTALGADTSFQLLVNGSGVIGGGGVIFAAGTTGSKIVYGVFATPLRLHTGDVLAISIGINPGVKDAMCTITTSVAVT